MSIQRQRTGRTGEDLATFYLERNGYRVIERNARIGRGEIDLIAELRDRGSEPILVFVEVKTLKRGGISGPIAAHHAVDRRKQLQVRRLARAWLASAGQIGRPRCPTGGWAEVRFDVIGVTTDGSEAEIEHLEAAF